MKERLLVLVCPLLEICYIGTHLCFYKLLKDPNKKVGNICAFD